LRALRDDLQVVGGAVVEGAVVGGAVVDGDDVVVVGGGAVVGGPVVGAGVVAGDVTTGAVMTGRVSGAVFTKGWIVVGAVPRAELGVVVTLVVGFVFVDLSAPREWIVANPVAQTSSANAISLVPSKIL
jgi:hypothetical protein